MQNTFILRELEGKIPLDAFTTWIVVKDNVNMNDKTPNLEDFVKFNTRLVDQLADDQYLRSQLEEFNTPTSTRNDKTKSTRNSRGDERGQGREHHLNLLNTNKERSKQNKRGYAVAIDKIFEAIRQRDSWNSINDNSDFNSNSDEINDGFVFTNSGTDADGSLEPSGHAPPPSLSGGPELMPDGGGEDQILSYSGLLSHVVGRINPMFPYKMYKSTNETEAVLNIMIIKDKKLNFGPEYVQLERGESVDTTSYIYSLSLFM